MPAVRSLGVNRSEVLTTVVLPTARPHLLTGLRLPLGPAWVVLVPAEMLGVTSGLGYANLNSRDQRAYDEATPSPGGCSGPESGRPRRHHPGFATTNS